MDTLDKHWQKCVCHDFGADLGQYMAFLGNQIMRPLNGTRSMAGTSSRGGPTMIARASNARKKKTLTSPT
eukprot:3367621-Lingulodinium_polyedra.AAC.1